jgi:CIC family chloride channel protein
MVELHAPDLAGAPEELTAGSLAHPATIHLLPTEDVRTALRKFAESQVEALPVVDGADTMEIVGFLTEAYALRRYNQELERRRAESEGQSGLFSSAVREES